MTRILFLVGLALLAGGVAWTADQPATDVFEISGGTLEITFIGHGTLMFNANGTIVHVDPWSKLADYSQLPKADLILITHEHGDHLDPVAVAAVRSAKTQIFGNQVVAEKIPTATVLPNGASVTIGDIRIDAVPAYNLVHMRSAGQPYHPKGVGNGYLIKFSDFRVYVAGDTENVPEMKTLHAVDVAFLPMNLPYTMTPEMVADAARAFRPRILYPYHFGNTDTAKLVELLADEPEIEVRLRNVE